MPPRLCLQSLPGAGKGPGSWGGGEAVLSPESPGWGSNATTPLALAEIFTPLPSAHRNFQTCSLQLPRGGAATGPLTLYLFRDCSFQREK